MNRCGKIFPRFNRINVLGKIARCLIIGSAVSGGQITGFAAAGTPTVTATLDLEQSGAEISTNFSGLSFEAASLLPDSNGLRYFRPDNRPLIQLFHTLGIKSLRIGGNTSDRNATQLPGPEDWDNLFGFARAANVKVIYCLQLYHGDSRAAARTVKYIMDRYAPLVDAFSIGQEPSAYLVSSADEDPVDDVRKKPMEKCPYPAYAGAWKRFADTIAPVVPRVEFCGPEVHNDPQWTREFITDFGRSNHLALITEHLYPGGDGHKVPSPETGRNQMLGEGFTKINQKLYEGFVPMAFSEGLPYRLTEVNNFYDGGATNVSNTFASALWGLDFMYWWAEHEATGVNFHSGDTVAAGSSLEAARYTAFVSTANGFVVRPLGYGIKAFALGSHGRMIPATVSNPKDVDLSIYAVLGEDQHVYVTVINKQNGKASRRAKVVVRLNQGDFADASVMTLTAPDDDVAARQGQTLGGAEIKEDGSWNGQWKPLKPSNANRFPKGVLEMEVPPASAEIIRFSSGPNG